MPHVDRVSSAKRVYLVGICGTAMASLAGMLRERGWEVTGSDEHVYPPMSTYLESLGIPILEGYTNEHIETLRPDLVVIGNAIARTNPEAVAVLELDLPYISMPEAIYDQFIRGRHSVVITGTHGKTTTTSLAAWLLESSGRDPGMMVGGIPLNFGQNYKLGAGEHFVIEGDEYNVSFFDRGPKFLHYRANTLVVNNIEFDHADLYDGLDAIVGAFRSAVERVEPGDLVVANGDDPVVQGLRDSCRARWVTFGEEESCDVRIEEITLDAGRSRFTLHSGGRTRRVFESPLGGRHNVFNATADIIVARHLGLSDDEIAEGLRTFRGVKRRMEVRGVERGVTVIDDFAHHPTAIRTTLAGARTSYPGRRLWALFEPRSISSARKEFESGYTLAFREADRVVIGPVFHRQRYETRYGLDKMMSVSAVLEGLRRGGVEAVQIESFDEIARFVAEHAIDGDVVVIMSSGAFGGVHDKILDLLRR